MWIGNASIRRDYGETQADPLAEHENLRRLHLQGICDSRGL
jgi:hypothetical protein